MADTIGFGAIVKVDDGGTGASSGSQTAFVEVVSIKPPFYETGDVETSHIATTGRVKTYIPGMIEPGMFSFTQRWTTSAYTRALTLSYTSHTWQVLFPDGTTSSFPGFVKKVEVEEVSAENVVNMTLDVKVTGAISYS